MKGQLIAVHFILQHGVALVFVSFIVNAYIVTYKFAFLTAYICRLVIFIGTEIC